MLGRLVLLIAMLALAGCSLPPSPGEQSRQQPRISDSGEAGQCYAQLAQAGVSFTPLPDRYPAQGCSIVGTVQVNTVPSDQASLAISNLGPVTCGLSQTFAAWARFGADRAARQILGAPLSSIETFGSYSCRDVAGTGRRSAHATASAIDVGAFVLTDGRRISVQSGWDGGTPAEREFLRVVQESACKRFGTVLGPDYNAAHRDHLHLEGLTNGRSFCR